MRYSILCVLFCLICGICGGQEMVTTMRDYGRINYCSCNISKYQIIDTTDLVIKYEMIVVSDTVAQKNTKGLVTLQVGPRWSKFYGESMHNRDISLSKLESGDNKIDELGGSKVSGDNVFPCEILNNVSASRLTVLHRIPWEYNKQIKYEESCPVFDWQIDTVCILTAGYNSFKAKAKFRGRTWNAIFTPEIARSAGPWKFLGLPGLILEVWDEQHHYQFKCVSISPKREQIRYYEIPTEITTRHNYIRFDRNAHQHPSTVLNQNGNMKFYHYSNGKMTLLDEAWSLPFNPIERE